MSKLQPSALDGPELDWNNQGGQNEKTGHNGENSGRSGVTSHPREGS